MKLTDLQFTPGPWKAVKDERAMVWRVVSESEREYKTNLPISVAILAKKNDAIVISGTPDLLAALVEARDSFSCIKKVLDDVVASAEDPESIAYHEAYKSFYKINKLLNEETK